MTTICGAFESEALAIEMILGKCPDAREYTSCDGDKWFSVGNYESYSITSCELNKEIK
jgi:hypothetical protein